MAAELDTQLAVDVAGCRDVGARTAGLAHEVQGLATSLVKLHGHAESGWVGRAGQAFRDHLSHGGQDADILARAIARIGVALDGFADDVSAAQARMAQAREVAATAGLPVTATGIAVPTDVASTDPRALAWGDVTATVADARDLENRAHALLQRRMAEQDGEWSAVSKGSFVAVALPNTAPASAGDRYEIGAPRRPPIAFDDDFVLDPGAVPGMADHLSWNEWGLKMRGASVLRPDLDDALHMYAHYRGGSGDSVRVDYEEAYREDAAVREVVDGEISAAREAAARIHRETGQTSFSITGDAVGARSYPVEENWQKALGGHTVWGSGEVRIDGDRATMTVTVHAEDRYNFNRGESDIASGTPDEENGRFAELGWARSFDVQGSVTRTVTWPIGGDPSTAVDGGGPERNAGGEDRVDEQESGR